MVSMAQGYGGAATASLSSFYFRSHRGDPPELFPCPREGGRQEVHEFETDATVVCSDSCWPLPHSHRA